MIQEKTPRRQKAENAKKRSTRISSARKKGWRILHYPEQKNSVDEQNEIGAHTDVECFTMVTQDSSGGLEVLGNHGNWIRAEPIPGSSVVNIADCFMRQTNDFFISMVHQVIDKSGRERYSAPFFFGFNRRKLLEPIPTCKVGKKLIMKRQLA
ncbi:hypothetical protein HFD88_005240 [Aspergillus terreus]|nr:hypothetical protein HFD88_005240 [Aspergillus terreus]